MANLISAASGNFSAAATWAVANLAGMVTMSASETGITILPNAAGASARSAAFTPGNITIDAILVRNGGGTMASGTVTVELVQAGAVVTGTTVTINMSDIPAIAANVTEAGWIVFKFSAPVTLAAATAYNVQAFTSGNSQLNLFRCTTTSNDWSRMLRTTTTQAPVAGDDMTVAGEYTGAGTGNNITVTMDITAATDYGSNSTSTAQPALSINGRGTLSYGTSAATNYTLRLSGNLIAYKASAFNIGTIGSECPRDSTMILEFDCAADGDFGLTMYGAWSVQGLSRTSGKNIVQTLLNANAAANATSLTVVADTGWLDNDQIAVASTTRTAGQSELGALNGNAGASSLTVDGFSGTAGGVLNAHDGISPTQAEVINITRNIKIRAVTSGLSTFVIVTNSGTADLDWVEFYYMGANSGNKVGIVFGGTITSFDMRYCSIHDFDGNGLLASGTAYNNVSIQDTVFWNLALTFGPGISFVSTSTNTNNLFRNCTVIKNAQGFALDIRGPAAWDMDHISCSGSAVGGIDFSSSPAVFTKTWSDIVSHSNASVGYQITTLGPGAITNITGWRNTGSGMTTTLTMSLEIVNLVLFGNTTDNLLMGSGSMKLTSPVLNSETGFTTTNGIRQSSALCSRLAIDNGDFSAATGNKIAHINDINFSGITEAQWTMNNTILRASVEVLGLTNLTPDSFISSEKHDQTPANHRTWMANALLTYDTTIFNTASPSLRAAPTSSAVKSVTAPPGRGKIAAALSGASITMSVAVRKDATYNGNQPRLRVRANNSVGISDTTLATASGAAGSWETLSGTTAALTDDGALEFYVDYDGTAGFINVDDWAAS